MNNKTKWHRYATALLGRIARELGINKEDRDIHSNKGGNAVGGEVTMSAPKYGIYVHLACPVNSYGEYEGPFGVNYVRKASETDPYGSGMDKPNHCFHYTTESDLVDLCKRVGGKSYDL